MSVHIEAIEDVLAFLRLEFGEISRRLETVEAPRAMITDLRNSLYSIHSRIEALEFYQVRHLPFDRTARSFDELRAIVTMAQRNR